MPQQGGQHSKEFEEVEISRMLDAGVIEPTLAEWTGPAVFVSKKSSSVHFRVDYR